MRDPNYCSKWCNLPCFNRLYMTLSNEHPCLGFRSPIFKVGAMVSTLLGSCEDKIKLFTESTQYSTWHKMELHLITEPAILSGVLGGKKKSLSIIKQISAYCCSCQSKPNRGTM